MTLHPKQLANGDWMRNRDEEEKSDLEFENKVSVSDWVRGQCALTHLILLPQVKVIEL